MVRHWKSWSHAKRYGLTLFLLTSMFVVVEYQLISREYEQKLGAEVVNVAGRQRMYSQRLVSLAHQGRYKEAHDLALKLQANHFYLLHGHEPDLLPPAYTPELRKGYESLSSNVETMKAKTRCLMQGNCESHEDNLETLIANSEQFLPAMDHLVNHTSEHLKSSGEWSSGLQALLIVSFSLLLLLSFNAVILPRFRRAEKESLVLKEDSQRSKMMESAAQIGSWTWNPKTDETHWSDEVYKIHGLSPDTPTHRIQGLEFYAEHERPKVQKLLEQVLREKCKVDGQFEFHSKNGSKKWVRVIAEPVLGENSEVHEVAGVFQDVSEQKLFERELIESKKYLELAMEGAHLGIWDWYLGDNSVKFDRRWAEMLGLDYSSIKMELSTWESRVHPEDLPKAYEDIKAYMDGRTSQYQNIHRMQHADGHWVYILDQGKFSDFDSHGKPTRFTGTHLDITETVSQREQIQQLELKNRESKSQTQLILEGVQMGIWNFYPKENRLIWDKSMYKVYDVDPESFEGHFDAWKKTVHPDDAEKASREFADFLSGVSPEFDTGFRIVDRNGAHKYIRARARIFRSLNGEVEQVMGVNWDVTAEFKAQKELEQQKALSQRSARLASIGVLAAGVGHEINNPLAIIKGYLLTLKDKQLNNDLDSETMDSYFGKISVAADRIGAIVQGLRTFSRSEEKTKKMFNTRKTVRETVEMVREIYARDGIQISVVGDGHEDFRKMGIHGYRGGFQQVLMNLLSNARHALKNSDNKCIEILMAQKGNSQEIIVRDYGTGLKPDVVDRIFDPFFTTKDVNEGTGIGLSLVHSLLEEMHGRIEARNHAGGGAEFLVTLPSRPMKAADSSASKPPAASGTPGRPFSGKRILVVDDEPELRQVLCTLLSLMGVQTKSVGSGTEALEVLRKKPGRYDLVISDVKMPDMDGMELNRRFFAEFANEPILPAWVFTTGGVNQDMSQLDADLRVDAFFYKPFDRADLQKVLQTVFAPSEEKAA